MFALCMLGRLSLTACYIHVTISNLMIPASIYDPAGKLDLGVTTPKGRFFIKQIIEMSEFTYYSVVL